MNVGSIVSPPATRVRRFVVPGVVLALLVGVYGAFLFSRFAPAISMPDDNGYFAQASLMVRAHSTWFVPQSDAQYIGMHWLLTPDGKYVSRYPAGLPMLLAPVYAVLGWKAAVAMNPLFAIAAVAGTFLLVRRLTGASGWGFVAGAVLAVNPTFNEHALAGDSHVGVACMTAWGMYFLVRWAQERKTHLAFLAGLVLGVVPTIRYPDAVMAIGFGAFVLFSLRPHVPVIESVGDDDEAPARPSRILRHVLAMAGGVAIPILPLLIRNQLVLGGFWKTGYALTNEQTGFGWGYFKEHFWTYLELLPNQGMALFFGLGLAGIVAMIGLRLQRAAGLMFLGVTIPMLLLYMAYYWGGMGQNGAGLLRFLVPTFVAYTAAGTWAVAELARRASWPGKIGLGVAVLSRILHQ